MLNKRILITGGAGFIGSHQVDIYLNNGYTVGVIDNFSTGKRENLAGKNIELFELDITNREATLKAVADFKPAVISHHAAQISIHRSLKNPIDDATVNILGTINLLDAAVASGVEHFIFISSGGAIYRDIAEGYNLETDPKEPLSPYGLSKLAAESYVEFFARQHHLNTTILRYTNVYGPRQDADGEAGVIAIFMNRLKAGQSLSINGTGEQMRDFIFVGDIARVNFEVTEKRLLGIYNVGFGQLTTINNLTGQILQAWQQTTGQPPQPVTYNPAVPGELFRTAVQNQKICQTLNWQPSVDLANGLVQTAEWVLKQT